jgi:hypothetical protein
MSDTISVVTVDEVLDQLGYDIADDTVKRVIERKIKTADLYLRGSLGKNYPREDSRVKELALIIVTDLYENRTLYSTVTGNLRKLADDMSLQIRLEMRESENESTV